MNNMVLLPSSQPVAEATTPIRESLDSRTASPGPESDDPVSAQGELLWSTLVAAALACMYA